MAKARGLKIQKILGADTKYLTLRLQAVLDRDVANGNDRETAIVIRWLQDATDEIGRATRELSESRAMEAENTAAWQKIVERCLSPFSDEVEGLDLPDAVETMVGTVERLKDKVARYQQEHEAWEFLLAGGLGYAMSCFQEPDGSAIWRCYAHKTIGYGKTPLEAVREAMAVKAAKAKEKGS